MPELLDVAIDELDTGHNVRRELHHLDELAASISDLGVLSPITVSRSTGGGSVLIAGHRRVAAAKQAGLTTVPAIDRGNDMPAAERLLGTLVENLLRDDLDPIDEATGYQRLVDAGWSQAVIATRLGCSKGHVSRRRRLLALPDDVQERVRSRDVAAKHAYQLGRLANTGLVDADRIRDLAGKPIYSTENALASIALDLQAAERAAKLTKQGVQAVARSEEHDGDFLDLRWVEFEGDGDHRDEACHRVAVIGSKWDDPPVLERPLCAAAQRHSTEGDSPLTVIDHDARWRERQAQQLARREEGRRQEAQVSRNISRRLSDTGDSTVIPAALRVLAARYLRTPTAMTPSYPGRKRSEQNRTGGAQTLSTPSRPATSPEPSSGRHSCTPAKPGTGRTTRSSSRLQTRSKTPSGSAPTPHLPTTPNLPPHD